MKLLTKEIAAALAAAYAHYTKTGESGKKVIAKYFTPWGNATWYVTEGGPVGADGDITAIENAVDWHLYGFCDIGDADNAELGFVMLSDLEGLKGPFGLTVERDLYYGDHTIDEVLEQYGRATS